MNLCLLDADQPRFPSPNTAALEEPDGLLAVGGNLLPETLISAYRQGVFPWFQDDDPILWWSPAERCVILPERLHISKSLRKTLRKAQYSVTTDTVFAEVVTACAMPRIEGSGGDRTTIEATWIGPEMIDAYNQLHQLGWAHSVEVWQDGRLVGGIYGVAVGRIFCGESMFSAVANGSKIAIAHLCQRLAQQGFMILDCQIASNHLSSLGAISIPRESFLQQLAEVRDNHINWPSADQMAEQILW
jgi:leucyl/phenylalanyl-tRNA--protein transferase